MAGVRGSIATPLMRPDHLANSDVVSKFELLGSLTTWFGMPHVLGLRCPLPQIDSCLSPYRERESRSVSHERMSDPKEHFSMNHLYNGSSFVLYQM